MRHRFKEGDRVVYEPIEGGRVNVIITGVDFEDLWYGPVPVYDLNNGRWCYEPQVIELVKKDKK